ncbi:MAG: hypothetical protein U9N42_04910 [Campylobacterota bacterium]|nr:hypothetical protein [Campylobacterota bacterium]
MSSAWTCSHQLEDECILLKKPCIPGMKGCTLYGKATFCTVSDVSSDKKEIKNRYTKSIPKRRG